MGEGGNRGRDSRWRRPGDGEGGGKGKGKRSTKARQAETKKEGGESDRARTRERGRERDRERERERERLHDSGVLEVPAHHYYHHHHLFLSSEGRWGTTDDFTTNFLHFPLLSAAFWDMANSRPVHSLMLSSHLFLCLPCLLPPFTVPCKMVFARPDERET